MNCWILDHWEHEELVELFDYPHFYDLYIKRVLPNLYFLVGTILNDPYLYLLQYADYSHLRTYYRQLRKEDNFAHDRIYWRAMKIEGFIERRRRSGGL